MKKSLEGPEVKERGVLTPQAYWAYVEDGGSSRDAEIGPIGRFIHSL